MLTLPHPSLVLMSGHDRPPRAEGAPGEWVGVVCSIAGVGINRAKLTIA